MLHCDTSHCSKVKTAIYVRASHFCVLSAVSTCAPNAVSEEAGAGDLKRLPSSLRVVLENLLRNEDGETVTVDDIKAFSKWVDDGGKSDAEIAYRPARILLQDFTGVPAVVDLAAMRDAMKTLEGDPQKINPLTRRAV